METLRFGEILPVFLYVPGVSLTPDEAGVSSADDSTAAEAAGASITSEAAGTVGGCWVSAGFAEVARFFSTATWFRVVKVFVSPIFNNMMAIMLATTIISRRFIVRSSIFTV